jgi:Uncharacterised nucleotidyltransferase
MANRSSRSIENGAQTSPEEIARDVATRFGADLDPIRLGLFLIASAPGTGGVPQLDGVFASWTGPIWEKLLAVAEQETLLTWVMHRLERSPLSCPGDVRNQMQKRVATRRAWNRYLGLEGVRLYECLKRADIESRLIKGAVLSTLSFGSPELRDTRDIDLLVSASDVHATGQELLRAGYVCQVDSGWLRDVHFLHSLRQVSFQRLGGVFEVDLHWRLHDWWTPTTINKQKTLASSARTVHLMGKELPWFDREEEQELTRLNLINSHRVEFKSAVDYVRSHQSAQGEAAYADENRTEAARPAAPLLEGIAESVNYLADARRSSYKMIVRELFGAQQTNRHPRLGHWAAHVRRVRTARSAWELALAAVSPNLHDYMTNAPASYRVLFTRSLARKIRQWQRSSRVRER